MATTKSSKARNTKSTSTRKPATPRKAAAKARQKKAADAGKAPPPTGGGKAMAEFEAKKGDSDNSAKLFYKLPAARRVEVTARKLRKRVAFMATQTEGWAEHSELRQAGTAMVEAFDAFVKVLGTVPDSYEPPKATTSSTKLEPGTQVFIREKFQEKYAAFGIEPGAALEVTRASNGQVLCKAPNGATPIISRTALQTTPVVAAEGVQA